MSETLINTALPRNLGCAAVARRLIRHVLGDLVHDHTLQDVLSIATELVDNAFVHGRGAIRLTVARFEDQLRIEVVDEGVGQVPSVREREPDSVGGWGLRIVDRLSEHWGAFEGTTHVWAEVRVRGWNEPPSR